MSICHRSRSLIGGDPPQTLFHHRELSMRPLTVSAGSRYVAVTFVDNACGRMPVDNACGEETYASVA